MVDLKSVVLIALLGAGVLYVFWQTRRLENKVHALKTELYRLKNQQENHGQVLESSVESKKVQHTIQDLTPQCPVFDATDSREKLLQQEIEQYENQIAHLDTLLADEAQEQEQEQRLSENQEMCLSTELTSENLQVDVDMPIIEDIDELEELEKEVEEHQDTTEFAQDDDLPSLETETKETSIEDRSANLKNAEPVQSSQPDESLSDVSSDEEYSEDEVQDELVEDDEETIQIKNIYNKFDDKYTVKQLKELCRKNNLKIQGIKRDLIDRLYRNNILVQN